MNWVGSSDTSDKLLLTHLANGRDHVLHAVDGLTEAVRAERSFPSGWTLKRRLNHLGSGGRATNGFSSWAGG